jgi:hypothetical protein
VEVANYCRCHTIIRARKRDIPYWFLLFVPSRYDINFGDTILLVTDYGQMPPQQDLFLARGPMLRYHVQSDQIPETLLNKIMAEQPWPVIPDDPTQIETEDDE